MLSFIFIGKNVYADESEFMDFAVYFPPQKSFHVQGVF